MRYTLYLLIFTVFFGCSKTIEIRAEKYFEHINNAELAICNEDFEKSLSEYEIAFGSIEKPFGKDIFNSALSSQLIENYKKRNYYLQQIVDNSDELDFVKSVFVGKYMTEQEWKKLISKKELRYDKALRMEFNEIHNRDQLFRPMYDTHDDTINLNRKINLKRILEFTDSNGFPSQMELGYSNYLRNQPHDIVLHHTAQRRSYDKTVIDLEPILKTAVKNGRFDPEQAIFYLNFQDDQEKGKLEVYSSWQYKHPLLPDSLNNKVWFPKLNEEQLSKVNEKRKEWYANSISDIKAKANFLNKSHIPFIFSSVKKLIGNMPEDSDKEKALEQYSGFTNFMIEK
ncbi:hypothetical protein [Aequorivita marina]|uniref:hypothetical protein n=1 Tax=Aequorivita marina TaxID=3073654 RepID=UPI002874C6FE|nr:hypothetical protein [Aequorivita sp. S2608]MDS1299156.1 hypothetical protein [Aequorivita sp. S2608]